MVGTGTWYCTAQCCCTVLYSTVLYEYDEEVFSGTVRTVHTNFETLNFAPFPRHEIRLMVIVLYGFSNAKKI